MTESQTLWTILLLDLNANIEKINQKASKFVLEQISTIEWNQTTKPVIEIYRREVFRKLNNCDLHKRLINDFMEKPCFIDNWKKEYTVPIFDVNEGILEMAPIDLEFADGVAIELSIKPNQESDLEILKQYEFEIKYKKDIVNEEQPQTVKLYIDSEKHQLSLDGSKNRISCSALKQDNNISAIDHDGKFRRNYTDV